MTESVSARFSVALLAFIVVFEYLILSATIPTNTVFAAVPNIINYQGRLEDPSGNALGGSNGTNYDFKFSIWDGVSSSSRVWPVSAPASTTLAVTNGVFSVGLGDTSVGFPALNLSFNSGNPYYLQVEVWNTTSSSFETLSPRQSITSAATAINAGALNGLTQGTSSNNLLLLDSSGNINLSGGQIRTLNSTSCSGVSALGGGALCYDSTNNNLFVFNAGSSTWVSLGGGSGGSVTLQQAYNLGNMVTTADAHDFSVTLANTTTSPNFIVNIATSSAGAFEVQYSGSNRFAVNSSTITLNEPVTISSTLTVNGTTSLSTVTLAAVTSSILSSNAAGVVQALGISGAGLSFSGNTLSNSGVLSLASNTSITFSAATGSNITATFLNPQGFITTSSITIGGTQSSTFNLGLGLAISATGTIKLATSSISQFANDSGYLTSATATTSINGLASSSFSIIGTAGDISSTLSGATTTFDLANTAVTAGSYTYASFTVDAKGRLTLASNGTTPITTTTLISGVAGNIFTFTTSTGIQITTSSGQLSFSNTGVTSVNGSTGAVSISTGLATSSPVTPNQYAIFSSGNAVTNGILFQNAGGTELQVSSTPLASTSTPLILLGPNALKSTNASGTYIGVNATSGFNGDFINFQVNSSTVARVSSSGDFLFAGNGLFGGTVNISSTATFASTTITGQATTTNLSITSLAGTGGCLSVTSSGLVATSTCSGGSGGGLSSSTPWTANFVPLILNGNSLTQSIIQQFANGLVIATGTGTWPVSSATASLLQLGSSTLQGGNVSGTFIGINASSGFNGDFINLQVNSSSAFDINGSGATTISASSTSALAVQDAGANNVLLVDTSISSTNAGIDITAGANQGSVNLLNFYSSSSVGLSGFTSNGYLFIATSSMYGATTTLTVCAQTNCTAPTTATSTNTVAFFASTAGTTTSTSIVARGVITSGLADVGEYIPIVGSSSDYKAGDILSVSSSTANSVSFGKSVQAYDPQLAGAITETAGLVAGGGDINSGPLIIALAGRIPIKVSAVNGNINVGDYVTASDFPGVGMRSTRPGRVLGIALQAFIAPTSTAPDAATSSATGTIMVFVNPNWTLGSLTTEGDIASSSWATTVAATSTGQGGANSVATALDQFTLYVKYALQKLGLAIANGVETVKQLFADTVTTNKLCLQDICITRDQLAQILQNKNNNGGGGNVVSPAPPADSSSDNTSASNITIGNTLGISFVSPTDGMAVSGTTELDAAITLIASTSVSRVDYQVDNQDLGQGLWSNNPPYSYAWNTATVTDGSHTLTALITDTTGATSTASLAVTVDNASSTASSTP